ncbi:uncharacterized protein CLUP02_18026 [Colletotrichum lupini]|uniref:Uncharacterized protein n=1 Tax=Colletotrichum lupini TaxID=145971 RepID=A0A9Q8SG77_9PEZI|nr:uncharacterized protein CLUP02_18026 [Colletotrichum lupini]UQC76513.1 hypothetical protein CLUP02_18026 [Colletotrichum lupini]
MILQHSSDEVFSLHLETQRLYQASLKTEIAFYPLMLMLFDGVSPSQIPSSLPSKKLLRTLDTRQQTLGIGKEVVTNLLVVVVSLHQVDWLALFDREPSWSKARDDNDPFPPHAQYRGKSRTKTLANLQLRSRRSSAGKSKGIPTTSRGLNLPLWTKYSSGPNANGNPIAPGTTEEPLGLPESAPCWLRNHAQTQERVLGFPKSISTRGDVDSNFWTSIRLIENGLPHTVAVPKGTSSLALRHPSQLARMPSDTLALEMSMEKRMFLSPHLPHPVAVIPPPPHTTHTTSWAVTTTTTKDSIRCHLHCISFSSFLGPLNEAHLLVLPTRVPRVSSASEQVERPEKLEELADGDSESAHEPSTYDDGPLSQPQAGGPPFIKPMETLSILVDVVEISVTHKVGWRDAILCLTTTTCVIISRFTIFSSTNITFSVAQVCHEVFSLNTARRSRVAPYHNGRRSEIPQDVKRSDAPLVTSHSWLLDRAPSFPPRTNRGPLFYPESSTLLILLQTPTSPTALQMFMLYGASVGSVAYVNAAVYIYGRYALEPWSCLIPSPTVSYLSDDGVIVSLAHFRFPVIWGHRPSYAYTFAIAETEELKPRIELQILSTYLRHELSLRFPIWYAAEASALSSAGIQISDLTSIGHCYCDRSKTQRRNSTHVVTLLWG